MWLFAFFTRAYIFVTNPTPMQTTMVTPAESLLQRLLRSEEFENDYVVSVEKSEGYTSLWLHSKPKTDRINISNTP